MIFIVIVWKFLHPFHGRVKLLHHVHRNWNASKNCVLSYRLMYHLLIFFIYIEYLLDHHWSWDIKGVMQCGTLKCERTQHEWPHMEDQEFDTYLRFMSLARKNSFWSFAIRQRLYVFNTGSWFVFSTNLLTKNQHFSYTHFIGIHKRLPIMTNVFLKLKT